jgi:hypothetical protein
LNERILSERKRPTIYMFFRRFWSTSIAIWQTTIISSMICCLSLGDIHSIYCTFI